MLHLILGFALLILGGPQSQTPPPTPPAPEAPAAGFFDGHYEKKR